MKNNNQVLIARAALGVAATALTVWSPARAQEARTTLEEIVVTAERREENVQKTAASISVRTGEDLAQQGKFSLADVLQDIPGISGQAASGFGGTGSDNAASGLVIRGIPSNVSSGSSTVSTAAAAAIYVDGVYEGVGRNFDIERVEVLRGPQGTLYGRSATAGLVAFHTRNPDLSEMGADVSLEAGNYDLRRASGALNLPLKTDVLGVRISANHYERDGYYGSFQGVGQTPDGGKGGAIQTDEARIKLLYRPSDRFSVLLGAAMQDNVSFSGGAAPDQSNTPGSPAWQSAPVAKGKNDYRQYWAEVTWDLGFATLSYMPAYRSWYQNGKSITAATGGANVGLIETTVYTPEDTFLTHEFRLTSNPASKVSWQLGALRYDNELENSNVWVFQRSGRLFTSEAAKKDTEAFGVFGQATYPFGDDWRLTAGLRWDYTKVKVEEVYTVNIGALIGAPVDILQHASLSGGDGERTFRNWTYKLRLEHDLTDRNMLYGGVSTGFSPGDITLATCITAAGTNICPLVLQAETLTSYEIGSKNRFLDDRLQVNGALYYNDYGAFQVGNVNISGDPNLLLFATLAVPLKSVGAELEVLYQITDADRVNLNLGYVDSRYENKPAGFANANAVGGPPVSPFTATLGYDHLFDLAGGSTLNLHGDVRYASSFDEARTATQQLNGGGAYARVDSHTLLNANVTWRSPDHEISLTGWVRNLSDETYVTGVDLGNNAAPFTYQYELGEPRTFGATLNVAF